MGILFNVYIIFAVRVMVYMTKHSHWNVAGSDTCCFQTLKLPLLYPSYGVVAMHENVKAHLW